MGGGLSLEDFCSQYGLSDVVCAALEKMQFEPGDDLSQLSDQSWVDAGLAQLSVNRVRLANKLYRPSRREQGA
jgi:hypothetical protein